MANANAPMFIQVIQTWAFQLVNGTGTTITTVATAGNQGSKVEDINISNNDSTTAYTLSIWINDGTTSHLWTTLTIPISAGAAVGTPPVSVFKSTQCPGIPLDSNGNPYIYLKAGYKLQVSVSVAVTSGKAVDVVATGGDF
jgi:hypothetical protein